jgi:hypothetical protein
MTESQRRWEAWFAAYVRIDKASPDRVEVPCPDGDGGVVRIAFVADPGDDVGMAYLWCDVGRAGIFLHRVGIPAGAARFSFDADEDEMDKVIPPDVHFLPPDPYVAESRD